MSLTFMRVQVTEFALRDEVFRRSVIEMLRRRSAEAGHTIRRIRFTRAEPVKTRKGQKPPVDSYYIEVQFNDP